MSLVWTQRANYIEIPTDCPQRDERLGWTGDAQIYVQSATLNSDVSAFYTKWLVDLDDGQLPDGQYPRVAPRKVTEEEGGPAWADAHTSTHVYPSGVGWASSQPMARKCSQTSMHVNPLGDGGSGGVTGSGCWRSHHASESAAARISGFMAAPRSPSSP